MAAYTVHKVAYNPELTNQQDYSGRNPLRGGFAGLPAWRLRGVLSLSAAPQLATLHAVTERIR